MRVGGGARDGAGAVAAKAAVADANADAAAAGAASCSRGSFNRCSARKRDGGIPFIARNCRLKFDRLLKPTR